MSDASLQYPDHWKKPPFITSSLLRYLIYLGTVTYFFLAIYTMEVNLLSISTPRGIPSATRVQFTSIV